MTRYVILRKQKVDGAAKVGVVAVLEQLQDVVEASGAEAAAKLAAKEHGDNGEGVFVAVPEGSYPVFDLTVEKTEKTVVKRVTPARSRPRRAAAPAPAEGS